MARPDYQVSPAFWRGAVFGFLLSVPFWLIAAVVGLLIWERC